MMFIIILLFWESSIAHNLGTTWPIQAAFSAKCTSPNAHFNQIENRKCEGQMSYVQLPTDSPRSYYDNNDDNAHPCSRYHGVMAFRVGMSVLCLVCVCAASFLESCLFLFFCFCFQNNGLLLLWLRASVQVLGLFKDYVW